MNMRLMINIKNISQMKEEANDWNIMQSDVDSLIDSWREIQTA